MGGECTCSPSKDEKFLYVQKGSMFLIEKKIFNDIWRQIFIMKPIVCKYRKLLDCESTSYELRANTPAVESVTF